MFHDNAHLHTAAHTVESLRQLNFEVLKHPLYSSDLTLSDCHLFSSLKDTLRGHFFASVQQVKEAMHAWLDTEPKTLSSEDIQKLVDC
jgi:hypothetical protein